MNEAQALAKMIAPGTKRPGKWRHGVIQIWVTRACDKSCFGCTQGSNLGGKPGMITVEQFEQAVLSLKGYFGVVGVFGGNPAMHPKFDDLCEILRKHVPRNQRGLWCNNPLGHGKAMRETFDPSISNLNVHLDKKAYDEFKRDWPESLPFGLTNDSRHSPCFVAMKDVVADEEKRWELIADCDINKHWSAMISVFRGELRAWFCEIAGAQSMLHQDDPDYPDTGHKLTNYVPDPEWKEATMEGRKVAWWQLPMWAFAEQVRKHCHECSVPLRGHGALAQDETGAEQVSETHLGIYTPKRKGRRVELVTVLAELQPGRIASTVDYLGNTKR